VAATEVEAVSAVTAEAVAEAVVEVEEAILEVAEEEMVDSVETEVAAFEAIEVEAEVAVVEGVVHLVVQWRIRYSRKSDSDSVEHDVNRLHSNAAPQNPKVAKTEDAMHPVSKKTLDLSTLKLSEGNPTRPGYGTRGIKVELTANYVELLPPSNMVLHRYDVDVQPDATGRKRHRVLELLLQSPEMTPYKGDVATDFRQTLVSKTKFKHDEDIIEIQYRSEGEDEPAANGTVYKIKVKYIRTYTIGELVDWMNSTNISQSFGDKQELTQALNIFLNHYVKSANNLATIGSSKSFSLNQNATRGDLGAGLEVIRGFFSSVRVATCRILVNINVSHGAFYNQGPLPGLMHSYGTRNTIALEKFLKLVRVQTTHLAEKRNKARQVIPRIKTIFGLARKDDGHKLANRPRIKGHGAGAKDVEFWLDADAGSSGAPKAEAGAAKGKGKGKPQPKGPAPAGSGKYISVFDFFKTSMLLSSSIASRY